MKRNKIPLFFHTFFAILVSITILFTGCSLNEWLENKGEEKKDAENDQQIFDYEVPENTPSILVNQLGYHTDSEKTALFLGENVPDTFSVIDAETKEEVFNGEIEHKGFENGDYISSGSFTGLTKTGEYYLLCDDIGQSYHFEISDNIYDELFKSLLLQISDTRWEKEHTEEVKKDEEIDVSGGWYTSQTDTEKVRDVKEGCETLMHLLLSAELYIEEQQDNLGLEESGNDIPDILDECAYEALWLLKMQDTKSGAVYSRVSETNGLVSIEEKTLKASQYFIIAMAKFSYSMKNYDNLFATECLRAADAAWKYVESVSESQTQEKISQELRFFGAAELYRASGAYRYHTAIVEYIPAMKEENTWSEEEYFGVYTYLGTRLSVQKNLCEDLMKQVMDLGESIAYESKGSRMLSVGVKNGNDCEELLEKMMIMTSVDYIIGNHEYDTILENNLHYLLGRNPKSYSFIEGFGNDEEMNRTGLGICQDIKQTSALMFMLSEIISNQ